MRIARLVERYPASQSEITGGLMPNAYYLSTLESQAGHEVTVFAARHGDQPERQELDGVSVVRLPKPPMMRTFLGLRMCRAIRGSAKPPEIVHALNPLPLGWLLGRARALLPETKFALSIHAFRDASRRMGGVPSRSKLLQHEFGQLVGNLAEKVDLLLPVSRYVRSQLEAVGVEPARMQVINPGVDTRIFKPCGGDGVDGVGILYVGRFSSTKNVGLLAEALQALRTTEKVRVSLIGASPKDDCYAQVIDDMNRAGQRFSIDIRPPIEHSRLPAEYSAHDIFVLPSTSEAFGKVALEAMSCGRPVVATRLGGLKEVIDHGKTGFLVSPKDPAELARSLEELAGRPDLRRKMGLQARKKAARFDWHLVSQRYLRAFESIL